MRIGTTSYRNIQNGPQTLRGVRETAIVKPIGEGMKLKLQSTNEKTEKKWLPIDRFAHVQ